MPRSRLQYQRVFFALTLPEAAERTLFAHQQKLAALAGADSPLRWTAPSNWHITLSFIGPVDARQIEQLLAAKFSELPPFTLDFGHYLYFAAAKVFALAPLTSPPALLALARACEQEKHRLRLGKREPDYQPHITLARARHGGGSAATTADAAQMPLWPEPPAFSCRFHELHLLESISVAGGVRYRAVHSWPLRRPLHPARRGIP